MEYNDSLGSLLQGVSQQNPSVRPQGKVSEQVNFVSDVVEGLTSRPALQWIQSGGVYPTVVARSFLDAKTSRGPVTIGYAPGSLLVWDEAGNRVPVTIPTTSATAYIGQDMRAFVLDDDIYLLNRTTPVQTAAGPSASNALHDVGIVYCLGGIYGRTYEVRLSYPDGAIAVGSYTTPDGTATGDAAKTENKYIIDALHTALTAHAAYKADTVTGKQNGTMYFRRAGGVFLTVADGEDGNYLRSHTTTVESVDKLAAFAPHGTFLKVTGDDAGDEDDFFLRFNAATTNTLGEGFGSEGVWEEWYDPSEITDWDADTMPHKLSYDGGSYTFAAAEWAGRRVGNSTSNPFPDIIGRPIRDIEGFQSRFVVVAGPVCLMSRTNEGLDFFKKSALEDIDTDPIEIKSTQQGTSQLDWLIPFDRDLVIMSDPGKGQFLISGASALTPRTASMVSTTSFEIKGGGSAKPVTTGRTILFPFQSGRYSGIKEFFTNDEVATNGAETITETLDKYIRGLVIGMETSTNFNMAVFQSDAVQDASSLYIYQYLWQNTEKVQAAWSRWDFPFEVEHFTFRNSRLLVVMRRTDPADAGQTEYIFTELDLERPIDDFANHHICLDLKQEVTSVNGKVQLPFGNARFVQAEGCSTPGRQVQATEADLGNGVWEYTMSTYTVPDGAGVFAGVPIMRSVKPTMPFIRDRNGEPAARTKVVINAFYIEYDNTGYMHVINKGKYRKDPSHFIVDFFPLDEQVDDPMQNGVRSGRLHVPWGERSDWSELTIISDDVRPTTIIEIEWSGEPFRGSRE